MIGKHLTILMDSDPSGEVKNYLLLNPPAAVNQI
jgi:hypothetical protein